MARKIREGLNMDMTPMIDMVFQLMIFFLVTIKMEQDLTNPDIKLAWAPSGPAIEQKDPRTIVIEVDRRGHISIANTPMTVAYLRGILANSVRMQGYGLPVMIRGDHRAKHADIRAVMDACSSVGLWRIQFAAVKQRGR